MRYEEATERLPVLADRLGAQVAEVARRRGEAAEARRNVPPAPPAPVEGR